MLPQLRTFPQIDVSVNKLKPTIPLINKWGDRWWMWTGGVKESEDVTLLIIKYNFNSGNIPQLCIGNSLSRKLFTEELESMLKTTSTTLSIPIPTDSKMEYSSISCSSSDPTVPENGMMLFSLSDNSEITLGGNTAITINITLNGFNYFYEITLTDVTSYKTNRTRMKLPSEYKHPELINLGYETIYESLFKEPQSFDSVTPIIRLYRWY